MKIFSYICSSYLGLLMKHLMCVLFMSMLCSTAQPTDKQWSPVEMMKVKSISDVQIAPGNKEVLFVASSAVMDDEKSINISRIYKASTKAKAETDAVALTEADSSANMPRISPDGKWIAFLSNRAGGVKNLYLMHPDGGEAITLTEGKKDVLSFRWAPNSQQIAFVMEDETAQAKQQKAPSAAYVYKEKKSVNRLWLINALEPKQTPLPLT